MKYLISILALLFLAGLAEAKHCRIRSRSSGCGPVAVSQPVAACASCQAAPVTVYRTLPPYVAPVSRPAVHYGSAPTLPALESACPNGRCPAR